MVHTILAILVISCLSGDEHPGLAAEGRVLHGPGGARVPGVRGPGHRAVPHVQAAQAAPGLPAVPGHLPRAGPIGE